MYVQGYLQGSENGRVVTIVSLDASYQVSDNLAMRFQRRFFRDQSETRITCGGHFVNGSGRNEQYSQRTFHRCFLLSFGSFDQTVSEKKMFRNRPIRNKNCLWQPYLLMDRDEMSSLYRGPPKMHPTKFRFIWQSGFRGEDFFRNHPIRNKNCL